jgi:hypothetical protein
MHEPAGIYDSGNIGALGELLDSVDCKLKVELQEASVNECY